MGRVKETFKDIGKGFKRFGKSVAKGFKDFKAKHRSVETLVVAGKNFREHQMKLSCAYFTYHAFIALFALILLASALLGFVLKSDPALQKKLLDYIYDVLPDLGNTLDNMLGTIVNNRHLVSIIGLVGLLWTGSKLSVSLETGFNVIQGTGNRPFWKRRLLALGVILLVIIIGGLFVGLGIFYSDVIAYIDKHAGELWSIISHVLGILLSFGLGFVVFSVLFLIVPRKRPKFRELAITALSASIAFHVVRVGFDYYFSNVAKTQILYGTIGVVIGILLWLYITGAVIFYCAEMLNILMTNREEREVAVAVEPGAMGP